MPRRTTPRNRSGATTVRVTGVLLQGTPLNESDEVCSVPAERIAAVEVIYQLAGDLPSDDLVAGDLLIVEPRPNGEAATGEFVIATVGADAFVGRYWKKHGARSLLDGAFHVIAQGPALRVLGAVTLILRGETH